MKNSRATSNLGKLLEREIARVAKGHARTAALVARFLEFGTKKMAANPFITRGWESSKHKAVDAIVESLEEDLGVEIHQ